MLIWRKILFYILVVVYVIACPLIIMYALGYSYKPGIKGGVVETGLISLATTPVGADIYINGKMSAQKTPALIRDLTPGDYVVKIKADGYRPWRRTVCVEAEEARAFDKILLLPGKWKKEEIVYGQFSNMVPLSDTNLLLIPADKAFRGEFVVYDCVNDAARSFSIKPSEFQDLDPVTFLAGKTDAGFLTYAGQERVLFWEKDRVGILDFSEKEIDTDGSEKGSSLTLVYAGGKDVKKAFWAHEDSHVLILDGNTLFLVEVFLSGESMVNDLFDVEGAKPVYYSEKTGKVYFFVQSPGSIFSADIIPRQNIIQKNLSAINKGKQGGV